MGSRGDKVLRSGFHRHHTVGTGIGGGVIIHGKPVHGLMHPEIGHIPVKPAPNDPMPQGICPYHGCCLEGMASGPAIEKRWGVSAKELPDTHLAWELEADYLAQLCASAMLSFSPEKIIMGGGVMQKKFLFPLIREKTLSLLHGYITHPVIDAGLNDYIVEPVLDTNSGIFGAYLLAKQAEEE
ncbi:MAG: ROK family protein [Clostridia bacterium]|nr:ROK family protein [Clostridia bacterium]